MVNESIITHKHYIFNLFYSLAICVVSFISKMFDIIINNHHNKYTKIVYVNATILLCIYHVIVYTRRGMMYGQVRTPYCAKNNKC